MTHNELFALFGPSWQGLTTYNINGVRHWVGCEVISLLGIKNITNAIKGTVRNRKLTFPAYRMHMVREVNPKRSIFMLTFEGVIQVIKRNSSPRCRQLQTILANHGM